MTHGITAIVHNPADGEPLTVEVPEAPHMLAALNALVPVQWDEVKIEYMGENPSLVTFRYKKKIVSQIEMYYLHNRLTEVVKK